LLLNDPSEFEGGDMEFYFNKDDPQKKRKIVKCKQLDKAGSLVVFPSYAWHRVRPVTKGVRYSLVMWHNGYPFR
jgi:PKHD-type hydroxylase